MFLSMGVASMATPFFISFQDMGVWCKIGDNQLTPQPPLLHTHVPINIGVVLNLLNILVNRL